MRALLFLCLAGCGVEQGRVDLREPEASTFPIVAEALAQHCATLDCHGQVGRNFRFYWANGLRLAGRPGEGSTTADEHRNTYRSLIALEPFALDAAIRGRIAPDQLTLVRKARGTEAHKGGAKIAANSDADRCLVSWLVGSIDTAACARATPPP
jgi:hypothetical protein